MVDKTLGMMCIEIMKAAMKPGYLYRIGEDGELYCVPAQMPKPGETIIMPQMTMPKEENDD